MDNFIVIFGCLVLGILFQRIKNFPANTSVVINAFIVYLSLPSLVLSQLPRLLVNVKLEKSLFIPVSMAWITFLLSFILVNLVGKRFHWSPAKIGALILTIGLGNTSFVGIPLLEALLGTRAIPIAILVDQPGSFLVLSTLGVITAAYYSGAKVTLPFIARRVFLFPPFISLLVSFAWYFIWGHNNPESVSTFVGPFEKVAATLVPLALFSVGYQLRLTVSVLKKRWAPLAFGLFFKLIMSPLFFYFFYTYLLKSDPFITKVIILESAMATMITAAIVATEFHLDSEIANLMVGVSIPISLISVPLWQMIFNF